MSSSSPVNYRMRRFSMLLLIAIISLSGAALEMHRTTTDTIDLVATDEMRTLEDGSQSALAQLSELEVKGRAPKTGYQRAEFGAGWQSDAIGCTMRNAILKRDLTRQQVDDQCRVLRGTLRDPYTGKEVHFSRGEKTSAEVQIDHVVALSNAWQTGAQLLEKPRRIALSNDPMNLLAVDGAANQQKGDGDAATWLPPNKVYRCAYVARQISVKYSYNLWVTPAEKKAMTQVLQKCPHQPALSV